MAESVEEIRAHVKVYMKVFAALLVLTVVTVAVSYLHLNSIAMAVLLALFVASIKGSLVACYFMHLIDERSVIYWVLIATVVFFVPLMLLPLFTNITSVFN